MDNRFKKIDQLFRDSLNDWQESPPSHIWSEVEHALDTEPADTKVSFFFEKRYVIVALLLIAAGTALFLQNNTPPSYAAATTVAKNTRRANTPDLRSWNQIPSGAGITGNQERQQENNAKADDGDAIAQQNNSVFPASAQDITIAGGTAASFPLHPLTKESAVPTERSLLTADAPAELQNNISPLPLVPAAVSINSEPVRASSTKQVKRFSLTVFLAPDITTRNLEQTGSGSQDENKAELMRTERNNAFDYTIGARIEYKLSTHFSLQTGISFSRNMIDIAPKTMYARYDADGTVKYRFNCSSGYAFFKPRTAAVTLAAGDSTQTLSSASLLHYVNIPLALKYNYEAGKFNFFAQAGITARFITKQSIAAVYAINGANEQNSVNNIQGLKTSYFNGVVGVGADYALSKRLAVSIFPSFNFATTSINRNAPVKAYPNTFSIASGLKFSF